MSVKISRATKLKQYIAKNEIFNKSQLARQLDMDYVNFYNWTVGKRNSIPEEKMDKLEEILVKFGYQKEEE